MVQIFKPSVNLINRLKYRQKLILLASIVVIIILPLIFEISIESINQIRFSETELRGIEINDQLISLMRKVQTYRGIKVQVQNNLAQEEELREAKTAVDHDIVEISELLKTKANDLALVERWEQIKNEWDNVKQAKLVIDTYDSGSDLIPNMQKLIVQTCDNSNLTIDPEIDTFYLIDAYCTLIPRFVENIENLHDIASTSLYTKTISQNNLDFLHVTTTLTQRFSLPSINDNIEKAITYNPQLSDKFTMITKKLNMDAEKFLHVVSNYILHENFEYSLSEFNNYFTNVEAAADQISYQTSMTLTHLIKHRIHELERSFLINLGIVFFGLLIFIYFFIGIYLSIMQSIRSLVLGSEEIAKGNLRSKVKLETQDELSQVADSFNTMREIIKKIVFELHHMVTAVTKGNLSQRVDLNDKEGFAKDLSVNINKMTDIFQSIIKDIITVLDFISKGNLTIRVTREYHGLYADLKNYVNKTIDDLESLIKSIKIATETIRNAAEEISLGNRDLEKRTEQQAASLEETSASMSSMTGIVQKNTDSAKQAHNYAATTSNIALEGGEVVNQVVIMMNAINESARQITEITDVIDNIAFQTNILALNAAVEAARAGEQGRGFTVVATEIRNLAQRSSVSAQGIKALINTSVEQVASGKKLADEAGKTMKEVVDSVKNVSEAMSEIVNASIDQASGIQQINLAISQMDQVTQQNSALVEEATRAFESLKNQTEQMNILVNVFKISSDKKREAIKGFEKSRLAQIEPRQPKEKSNTHSEPPSTEVKPIELIKEKLQPKESQQPDLKKPEVPEDLSGTPSSETPSSASKNKITPPEENPDEWTEF